MVEGHTLIEIIKDHAASDQLKLPIFPKVAVEIQKLIAKKSFSLNEFSTVISRDQSLASEVLKLANSAFFSGFRKVNTIQNAVMRLGTKQALNCVVMMGQRDIYRSSNEILNAHMKSLWKHAVACALGTKWFLEKIGYSNLAQEGLLAGLLHDIGKLLLLKVVEKISTTDAHVLSDSFVQELLDNMHAQEGYQLMQRWSIPDLYCNVARDHHEENFNPDETLLLAVRIVNQACRKIGIGMNQDSSILLATLPEVPVLRVKEIVLAELEVILEDVATTA